MKRAMTRLAAALLACCAMMTPGCALAAGEGDPLLSVDDLLLLEESYSAFLDDLEALLIERELLFEKDRQAWRDAQMGDFFQNGGYGSILAAYSPGLLDYVREEDTRISLNAALSIGRLEVVTVRRYSPQDSTLSGLMLTMSVTDEAGLPMAVQYRMSATSGVFLKWDPVMGAYVTVGTGATSDGETVCWSDQTPVLNANNPQVTIEILDDETEQALCSAVLTLTVDGDGYSVEEDALSAQNMDL